MLKPSATIDVVSSDSLGLVSFGNNVVEKIGASSYFTTPAPNPALTDVTTAITALTNACAARGSRSNYGSKNDVVTMRNCRTALRLMLTALCDYVNNVAATASNGGIME